MGSPGSVCGLGRHGHHDAQRPGRNRVFDETGDAGRNGPLTSRPSRDGYAATSRLPFGKGALS